MKTTVINSLEHKRLTLDYINKYLNWGENHFIKDDKVFERRLCHTTHSFYLDYEVREASDEDYFVAGVVEMIKKIKP